MVLLVAIIQNDAAVRVLLKENTREWLVVREDIHHPVRFELERITGTGLLYELLYRF